jgi:hypothetical protein
MKTLLSSRWQHSHRQPITSSQAMDLLVAAPITRVYKLGSREMQCASSFFLSESFETHRF